MAWDSKGNVLKGQSRVVAGDPYEITVYAPDGYRLASSSPSGAVADGPLVKLSLAPAQTGILAWEIKFVR